MNSKKSLIIIIITTLLGGISYLTFNPSEIIKKPSRDKNYFELFKTSAEHGNTVVPYHVGLMYYHGDGTTQNYQKAFEWVKKSAEQGNAQAQHNLGFMYYHGKGTSKNYQKAYTHFLIYDYLEKEKHTANEYLNKLEQKLTPQAIEYAQNEAEKMIQNFKRTYGDK